MTKNEIINTVCEVCGVKRDDLTARGREQDVVMARHLAAHYLFYTLGLSMDDIAAEIGVKYARSLYGLLYHNRAQERAQKPWEQLFKKRYDRLERMIRNKS